MFALFHSGITQDSTPLPGSIMVHKIIQEWKKSFFQ
jgi:hypothetical protein